MSVYSEEPFLLHHLGRPPLRSKIRGLYVAPWLLKEKVLLQKKRNKGICEVTLDDGYMDNHSIGLQLFKDLQISATVFLVANHIGGNNTWDALVPGSRDAQLMSESQVREWISEGNSIGAHTLSHARLTCVTEVSARAEICDSRKKLQDMFQLPIQSFAYPWGAYSEALCDIVANAGYEKAYSVSGEVPVRDELKLFCQPRNHLVHPKPALAALLGKTGDQIAKAFKIK